MLNQIIVMGRLVADPELKKTTNGVSFCNFRIACDRDRQTANGQKTDFINCTAWRQTAEFVGRYFNKGKPILVSGRLQMREWQAQDGSKRTSAEILVGSAEFCGGERVNQPQAGPTEVPTEGVVPELAELGMNEDDLPWEDHDLK